MVNFKESLKKYKLEIDNEIDKFFKDKIAVADEDFKHFYQLLRTFVMNGGKRLRPIAFLMTYKGLGGLKDITKQSLAVEFFHNATLIEDDFMDEDDTRRGKPTVYKTLQEEFLKENSDGKRKGVFTSKSYNVAVSEAVLLSNILYSFGQECLESADARPDAILEALRLYNNAFKDVNRGQLLDMSQENKIPSEEEYLKMAELKSAKLVSVSMEIASVLAGVTSKQRQNIKSYAKNVALAFQIRDDLMDLDPGAKKGHELASDLKQGKKTLPIVKALETKDKRILKVLGDPDASSRKVDKAIEAIRETEALDYCRQRAAEFIEEGKSYLPKTMMKDSHIDFFDKLADYVVERTI